MSLATTASFTVRSKVSIYGEHTVRTYIILSGYPTPQIKWYKNGLELGQKIGPKYRLSTAHGLIQLEILRSKVDDSGIYKIVAQNSCGKVGLETKVVIREAREIGHGDIASES